MVYAAERSVSPEIRERSPSAEPGADAGPSKRVKLTPAEYRRREVERLFEKPDREIQLPTATKERTVRAPAEMMKNVQGSSAGAGSGEFHVYKQSRRREYERLKIMEDKNRAEEEQRQFQARQAERDAVTEAKTAKNRAKRDKRKKGKKGIAADGDGSNAVVGPGGLKRKLAGASGVVFKRPGEEAKDSEDEAEDSDKEDVGPTLPAAAVEAAPAPVTVPVIEENKILIHDDD